MRILRRIQDALVDSLISEQCPRCRRLFKASEARDWPRLRTTWGIDFRVCPDCYREEHSWKH